MAIGKKVVAAVTAERRPAVVAKVWAFAQRQQTFGYQEVSAEMSITHDVATGILKELEAEGKIRVLQDRSPGKRKIFEVAPDFVVPTDRPSQLAQQLWSAMRGLKTFSPTDLAAHCTPELQASRDEASEFCQLLLRGEYLIVKRLAVPGKRDAIYQLINYTGPRPPRARRVRAIWDDNTKAYSYIAGQAGGAR